MRAARPPIFFKQQDSFRRQLRRWTRAAAAATRSTALAEAEVRMKTTGLPAETICREAMFAIAQMARAGSPLSRARSSLSTPVELVEARIMQGQRAAALFRRRA